MKRIFYVLSFAAFIVLNTGCKKDWTCVCHTPSSDNFNYDIPKASKDDATNQCKALEVATFTCSLN